MHVVGLEDAAHNTNDLGTFWKDLEAGIASATDGACADAALCSRDRSVELPALSSVLQELMSKCPQRTEPQVFVVCGSVFLMDEALTLLDEFARLSKSQQQQQF